MIWVILLLFSITLTSQVQALQRVKSALTAVQVRFMGKDASGGAQAVPVTQPTQPVQVNQEESKRSTQEDQKKVVQNLSLMPDSNLSGQAGGAEEKRAVQQQLQEQPQVSGFKFARSQKISALGQRLQEVICYNVREIFHELDLAINELLLNRPEKQKNCNEHIDRCKALMIQIQKLFTPDRYENHGDSNNELIHNLHNGTADLLKTLDIIKSNPNIQDLEQIAQQAQRLFTYCKQWDDTLAPVHNAIIELVDWLDEKTECVRRDKEAESIEKQSALNTLGKILTVVKSLTPWGSIPTNACDWDFTEKYAHHKSYVQKYHEKIKQVIDALSKVYIGKDSRITVQLGFIENSLSTLQNANQSVMVRQAITEIEDRLENLNNVLFKIKFEQVNSQDVTTAMFAVSRNRLNGKMSDSKQTMQWIPDFAMILHDRITDLADIGDYTSEQVRNLMVALVAILKKNREIVAILLPIFSKINGNKNMVKFGIRVALDDVNMQRLTKFAQDLCKDPLVQSLIFRNDPQKYAWLINPHIKQVSPDEIVGVIEEIFVVAGITNAFSRIGQFVVDHGQRAQLLLSAGERTAHGAESIVNHMLDRYDIWLNKMSHVRSNFDKNYLECLLNQIAMWEYTVILQAVANTAQQIKLYTRKAQVDERSLNLDNKQSYDASAQASAQALNKLQNDWKKDQEQQLKHIQELREQYARAAGRYARIIETCPKTTSWSWLRPDQIYSYLRWKWNEKYVGKCKDDKELTETTLREKIAHYQEERKKHVAALIACGNKLGLRSAVFSEDKQLEAYAQRAIHAHERSELESEVAATRQAEIDHENRIRAFRANLSKSHAGMKARIIAWLFGTYRQVAWQLRQCEHSKIDVLCRHTFAQQMLDAHRQANLQMTHTPACTMHVYKDLNQFDAALFAILPYNTQSMTPLNRL